MLDKDMGRFVGQLIELGHRAPVGDFKDAAMELLAELIPFDMALWASGYTQGLRVHNVYLRGLPEEMMENWERFKHQDRLLANIIATPGVTFDVYEFYARQERQALEIYRQHSHVYGIESAISTALAVPRSGLLDVMSLYRNGSRPAFTPEERAAKQFVFPLLTQAWQHNQIEYVRSRSKSQTGGPAAVCDREGWLRQASDQFLELVQAEWPEWSGPALPDPPRRWLKSEWAKPFRGKGVGMKADPMDDLFLLAAHPRQAAAMLSPREEEIAESFAAGLTYKDISREFNLSPSTVRRHLEAIYKKLGVSNKIELYQALNPG
ncbi:MAG: helix-turn-helix transcriptional regulator [Desulfarculaceae bacterium]|nr:helix-turn-helix transcriptional regulator [Desulfarculaceae bacterium]MCF8073626.1 helix-turn-helix transcriptional regulator [Desulfarculaceae bacterium]MCF8103142.1 helix-turn-helix transcriptional regulator [Desulfarculaceae bacterium]MCF8115658.1 helix-turn-helix transcriptional regulator [Desulfarculaceae bacterium]